MTSHEKRKFKIPEYARVFWNQAPMMQSASDTDLMITYDKDEIGRKAYALYDNPAAFYKDILTSNRNAYELIQENKPCPLNMDVEWYGLEDVSREQIGCIIHELRDYCLQKLTRNIDINVVKSSRLTNRGFKNSYHMVSPTVVFDNNHDGTMREFIDEFRKKVDFDFAPNGCIDMSIYTPNRNMRLPHCCKFGSDVPFIRISNDALEDDFSGSYDDPTDEDSYAPFILTNPEINGDVIQIHTEQLIQTGKQVKSKKRSRDEKEGGPTTIRKNHKIFERDQLVLPFQLDCLRELLVNSGDTVSVPTKTCYIPDEKQWQIQCDQCKQLRHCLATPGTTHTNNNCLLFVSRFNTGFRISYQCMASECSHYVKPVLGYINFVNWEWHTSLLPLSNPDIATPPLDEPFVDHRVPSPQLNLNPVDLTNPAMNTYELVKQRHEKNCFKLTKPAGSYCRFLVDDEVPEIFPVTTLKSEYRDTYYYEQGANGRPIRKRFIDDWIDDVNKRRILKIVVDPTCTQTNVLNIWEPFAASLLNAIPDSIVAELVEPIVHHILKVYANNNEEDAEYMLDWTANMIQHPDKKSQIAILLFGEEGCGKNIIYDFFRTKILGPFSSFQTAAPEDDIFGKFAPGITHRVFVQIDEVFSLHDKHDKLKNLITSTHVTYETKGIDKLLVQNLVNVFLTTNNENALTVTNKERRLVMFRCSSVYVDNASYFKKLGAHLNRPDVARAFFQFLMARDLSKYDGGSFQTFRPRTDYLKESQLAGIPIISRFTSAYVNSGEDDKQPAGQFYATFCHFHSMGNFKHNLTISAFARELTRIPGVAKHRTNSGMTYIMDKDVIKKHLIATNRYDEDAFLY